MRALDFIGGMVLAGIIYIGVYNLLKWINRKNEPVADAAVAPKKEEDNA